MLLVYMIGILILSLVIVALVAEYIVNKIVDNNQYPEIIKKKDI